MVSILLGILAGVSILAASVAIGEHFLPQIMEWFNNSIEQLYQLVPLLPTWVMPYILVAVAIAVISLGVKLL